MNNLSKSLILFVLGTSVSAKAQAPDEISITDIFNRALNDFQVTLVDWQGHVYNPCIRIYLSPPANAQFPFAVEAKAEGTSRLMIADVEERSPQPIATKQVTFKNANDKKEIKLRIAPDRNGQVNGKNEIEWYELNLYWGNKLQQTLPIVVIDQDDDLVAKFPFVVDFDADDVNLKENGYQKDYLLFADKNARTAVQTAINDWFYFFKDPGYDRVEKGAEVADIPGGPDGWNDNRLLTKNRESYTGFYVFVRTIYGPGKIHSTGYPVLKSGVYQTIDGRLVDGKLPRSGVLCIESNPSEYKPFTDLEIDDWHQSGHYYQWQTLRRGDIYGLTTHEFGHTIAFEHQYENIRKYQESRGRNGRAEEIEAYTTTTPILDGSYHLTGSEYIDRISARDNFPARRWMISKLDLLFAQLAGWTLRTDVQPLMKPVITSKSELPDAEANSIYSTFLDATGGVPFYDWQVVSGSLPTGLTLNRLTGEISGIPEPVNGKFKFTIRLRDYDELSAPFEKQFTLAVGPHKGNYKTVPLISYWSNRRTDSYLGAWGEQHAGYRRTRVEGYLLETKMPNTVALKVYWNPAKQDNLIATADLGENVVKKDMGYRFYKDLGYVYANPGSGRIPLKLYFSSKRGDCLTTATSAAQEAALKLGYRFVGDVGYVLKSPIRSETTE